nr:rRNA-processing protein UTP23 homolog [Tanacetum cinerariifolium]
MKLKKQKRHRRSVAFFTTCYNFRAPFKILCDGTFIHHLLVNRITPADTAISNILGAPVKLFTTRCVLAELKSLGAACTDSLNVARDLAPARCDHEKRKSAVDCLTDVIGEKNSEHFFVASQDADLRKQLQEVPAVPLIYALRNALFLESPSPSQQQFAKSAEEERSHVSELELKMLFNMTKRSSTEDEAGAGDSTQADDVSTYKIIKDLKKDASRRKTDVKDRVQFKRKIAKGPNPLSCKKKKKENQKPVTKHESNEGAESTRSRSKKRKRSRKQKIPTSATD